MTLAFIPSDGRSLSQLSLMPDHLIRIDNGVMAISRTFAWCSTCTIYVMYDSAKCSYYWLSSSRTRSHYQSHAFYSLTLSLPHIITATHFSLVQSAARNKKCLAEWRNHEDQHGAIDTRLYLFSWRQEIKAISRSYCYHFDTSEVITKTQNSTSRSERGDVGGSKSFKVVWFIYLLTYLCIYFLHLIRSFHSSRDIYDHL